MGEGTLYNYRAKPLSDEEHARLVASPPNVRQTSDIISGAMPIAIGAAVLVGVALAFGLGWRWYGWLPLCAVTFFVVPMLAGLREGVLERKRILEWTNSVLTSERDREHARNTERLDAERRAAQQR